MKHFVVIFLFLASQFTFAQNYEDRWTDYFSYVSVKSISQGNDKIYAASENAIFIYDLSTNEIETISTVNGLSGESISTIHYSENNNLLVIGYENGLMDVVIDDEENVLTVVDILDKQTIPPNVKRINHFNEYNNILYISTQYGISLFDLSALEFGDTYFIGDLGTQIDVAQTIVQEPYIFAATAQNGIKRAMVADDNLIDYQNWDPIIPSGGFKGVQVLEEELYVAQESNTVSRMDVDGGLTNVANFSAAIVGFKSNNNILTITTTTAIQAYSVGFVLEGSVTNIPNYTYTLQSGYAFKDTFYLGTATQGMFKVSFSNTQVEQILPDGPLLNKPFAIDASPGQLWVVFGEVTTTYNPDPEDYRGISNLREGVWTNTSYNELSDTFGGKVISDLVKVTINPNDPNEAYVSSFKKGLLKLEGQEPAFFYDQENSALELPTFINPPEAVGIRLYGSEFDREGNLWFVQSLYNNGLLKLTPSGQIQKIDITSIIDGEGEQALTDLAITREGNIFFGTAQGGLIGYNPNSNRFNRIQEGVGNGDIPKSNARTLAVDNQNRLWIGTSKGLRVLYNVGGFFEEDADIDAQPIIILEDGVPQELLYELFITDIEVDGSNNKWIATSTSGVFYLSANGQETLLRFTKDNSPLPTNNVQDISIDSFTGAVYFATTNGLVAYNGTATAPRDNLENVYAFPNPVRPGFTGNVTIDGLTADANVKITDIEGNLVFEETSEGGSVLWDTTAFGKYRVASGVYLVLITTEDALETKVSKIMVIR
ncbi:type IX secretion system anionic LPS delivery protein PorZ [Ulvibacter litoralis]|uniref:Por secretion system C-terminal sorting domain-containing protein n=1 Tax=Ulvibacter litoralis TaxID=227084 RepID=A0A1G7DI80_9FLAO|nr:two-component regulator propeller domain-containing protein [Ulvibacter litoralis]GHC43328.1 ABC transporter substrate-binding protein [Ulvibacter litoralis]SDE51257.1 Por secretion system C-terminal sorting domain-containing protein [Ulvibacter litoralis]